MVISCIKIVSVPYFVLMKLGRDKATDIVDLQRILHGANETEIQAIIHAVETYAPTDLDVLQHLITLSDEAL